MDRRFGVLSCLVCALFSFTSLDAQSGIDVKSPDFAFPQIAVGGQFETVLQIINEVAASNVVEIKVFQGSSAGTANGTPFAVQFDGGAPTDTRSVTLSASQEFTTILTSTDSAPKNGWVRVSSKTTGGKISGNLLFRQKSGTTVIDSVGVSSPQRFRYTVIQVDNRETGSNTGVAFVNPDTTPVNVTIDLYQADTWFATFSQTLQSNQHFAKFVSEMFPTFGKQQGTLVIDTQPRTFIPFLTLRADAIQLTGIPVRPLGFVLQYTVKTSSGGTVETGFWMLDFVGSDLVGIGRRDTDPAGSFFSLRGSWFGTNFQFSYQAPDNSIGTVIFNGTSAGSESTRATPSSDSVPITGKVTTIGANGQVVLVNDFSAQHKY